MKKLSRTEMKNVFGGIDEFLEDEGEGVICIACTSDSQCASNKVCRSSPSCTEPKVCAKQLYC